jgi:hypothetical protein
MRFAQIFKGMLQLDSIKIYSANILAFLSTFADIDVLLKRGILLVSIVYTVAKVVVLIRQEIRKSEEKKKEEE